MVETNKVILGDCIEEMKKLPENSVDAIITDPPYGLEFMGKEWDIFNKKQFGIKGEEGKNDLKIKKNFKILPRYNYDKLNMQKFFQLFGLESIRVLKPGAFMLVMGGTRTYHRMVCGIEDAGFEIRDTIMWLYGSGFPKSLNIGLDFDRQKCRKQLTKKLGRNPTKEEFKEEWKNFRKVVGEQNYSMPKANNTIPEKSYGISGGSLRDGITAERVIAKITQPVTPEAKEWEGWGTALKPAMELIVVARKPLSEKNVALNVLKHGTGGINIDACRIGTETIISQDDPNKFKNFKEQNGRKQKEHNYKPKTHQGRFPTNIILECTCDKTEQGQEKISGGFGAMDIGMSDTGKGITQKYDKTKSKSKENKFLIHTNPNCPCYMLDEQSGESLSSGGKSGHTGAYSGGYKEEFYGDLKPGFGDKGGASRFFYCAKASKSERNFGCEELEPKKQDPIRKEGNSGGDNPRNRGVHKRTNFHPTVKPISLFQYLIKLVSRENATILDPFGGSGTTAIACLKLNRKYILMEKEPDYVKIARARIKAWKEKLKPFLEQRKLEFK